MKEENGITLVALILTIVVMVILTTISIQTGTESIDSTKLQGFYTHLEVIQKRVDDIAATNESYIDKSGKTVYIKDQGADLKQDQKNSLKNILISEGLSEGLNDLELDSFVNEFRYFTIQDLENIMDLSEIDYDVFINFENRVVIAEKGLETADKTYYVLENTTYFVNHDETKNIVNIERLDYKITKYTDNTYKVIITPINIYGEISEEGYIKYKKTTTKYWETSNNLEIIVESIGAYDIIYMYNKDNKFLDTLELPKYDFNIDGNIDEKDKDLLSKYISNWNIEEEQLNKILLYGDINEDGEINLEDLNRLTEIIGG